jgi:hypothetical protein
MIDLQPVPIPDLSDESMASHRATLIEAITKRRHRPMKWAALVGATGVAATVSTLVFVGGSGPDAFAGWAAHPTAPATGQLTSADTSCQTALAQLPPSVNKGTDPATLVPELSDVRGPYTVTMFGNGSQGGALCISEPSGNSAIRWITWSDTPVGTGAIAVDRISVSANSGQPSTLVEGRTGDGVTGVTLTLGDGSHVTATSGNGFFLAWWPGTQSITSASVATATGTSTQALNLAGPGISSPPGTKSSPIPPGSQSSSDSNTVCLIHSCG